MSSDDLTGGNPDGNAEIFLWTQGVGFTQITDSTGGGHGSWDPSINADGTSIAFESDANLTGGNPDRNVEIFLWTQGSGLTQVTNTTRGTGSASINADGARIAFVSSDDLTGGNPDGNAEIFLWTQGVGFTQITSFVDFHNYVPSINADGTRIAFVSGSVLTVGNPDRNVEIFLWTQGVGFTKITESMEVYSLWPPSINADGTRIAFRSNNDLTGGNPDRNVEIFLWTQGSGLTQVTNTEGVDGAAFPSINADGTRIAFEYDYDLTGGNPDGNSEIFLAAISTTTTTVPVVLVHGWGGNSDECTTLGGCTFGQMKPLLEQYGFAVRVYDYSDFTSCTSILTRNITIEQIAGKFGEWLGVHGLSGPGKQIDVVAHSMGGLVVRAYMAEMGVKEDRTTVPYGNEIRRLVMIGTPNYGITGAVFVSVGAVLGCLSGPNGLATQAAEMEVSSHFLDSLNSNWPSVFSKPNSTTMLVIAGIKGDVLPSITQSFGLGCFDQFHKPRDFDGVVTTDNAKVPGALYREVPYRHSSIVSCPSDGKTEAFIDSSSHLAFATLVPFLQNGTPPSPPLYTRPSPGGVWLSAVRFDRLVPRVVVLETQHVAEDLTWAEVPGGGLTPLSPAVAAAPNGDVYVVVQGVDNHIYLNIQRNGTWLGWAPHPSGRTGSSPAAVVDVNGSLQVFVHGVDDAIYQSTYSGGSWSEWAEVPGGGFTFSASETAVNRVTGELTLLVRGIDSQIYLNTYRGATWSGWSAVPVGGLTLSELGATYDASGTLWLFARGIDAGIWVTSRSGGRWSGWTGLGGTTPSGLAAVASGNTVVVFAHGSDDRIYHNSYSNGQWGGWNEVPGYGLTKDAPAATVDSQGNVLLVVRGW